MRLGRSVRLSVRALLAHRVRTALAVSSVSAGVAAVVLTSAIGSGAERDITRRIDELGVNLLVVRPVQTARSVARRTVKGTVTTLRLEDHDAIARLPVVAWSAPGIETPVWVKAGSSAMVTRMMGTTREFSAIRRFKVRSGRFFDADDDHAARRVVVLGARVASAMFAGDPVGEEVRIGRVPFEVIGVLAGRGAVADGDEDNQVLVPIRTAQRRVVNTTSLNAIFVSVADPEATAEAARQIGAVLRQRHRAGRDGQPDFEIQDATRFFTMQRATARTLGRLTIGLGAVALLVGGAGITALMLLSVKERTTEIGLRIAVGARSRDILVQFLVEATILTLGGWMGGMLLGGAGALLVATSTAWPVGVPTQAVLASLAMSLVFGLGFGAVPARQAAMVPPIQALLAQ